MCKRFLTVIAASITISTTSFAGFGGYNTNSIKKAAGDLNMLDGASTPPCDNMAKSTIERKGPAHRSAQVVNNLTQATGKVAK
ncbi:MAG: hypothetical protein A4S09_10615 [Proteobacteria bacterium SG_bin7]|nr:MAG: hypothetical protein A4S09_10615 [Proteobacteria bacterium SG_bin7]